MYASGHKTEKYVIQYLLPCWYCSKAVLLSPNVSLSLAARKRWRVSRKPLLPRWGRVNGRSSQRVCICNNQNWFACVLDTATHTHTHTHTPPIVMFRTSFYCNPRLLAASLLTQITFSYRQHSLTQMPYYTVNTYSTPIDAHAVLSQFTIDAHDILIQSIPLLTHIAYSYIQHSLTHITFSYCQPLCYSSRT